jgi:hypothetical protein
MEKLKREFQEIQNNISVYSYEELRLRIARLIPRVPVIISITDKIPRVDKGLYRDPSIIYRARPNESKKIDSTMEMPWNYIKQISIVPDDECDKIQCGRANREKEPRFYASNDFQVSCYETIWHEFPLKTKEKSQTLTVGCWKINEPLYLAILPYSKSYLSKVRKHEQKINDVIDSVIDSDNKQIENLLLKLGSDKAKDRFIIDLFSDEFAKLEINSNCDYSLSNFYCEQVFERCPNEFGINDIDGIVFPSVSFSYQYNNIVLHPRCLHKLKFIEAMYVWVTYSNETKEMQYTPLEQHVIADTEGKLMWNVFKSK